MRKLVKLQLLLLVFGAGFGLIFLNWTREKSKSARWTPSISLDSKRIESGGRNTYYENFDLAKNKKISSVPDADLKQPRSLPAIKSEIKTVMQKQEAKRCRILKSYSDGTSDFTLVAVDLPNSEQAEEIRHAISIAKSDCSKSHHQELDDTITKLISEYDPFGTMGKRAFFVTVSKDNSAPHCSAFLFTVDDFESLPEKLDPNRDVPYSMENAKWYQNPNGGVLNRLREIMR